MFANQDLWSELLAAGQGKAGSARWFKRATKDNKIFAKYMRPLCNFGLVNVHQEPTGYDMHNYTHEWLQATLTDKRRAELSGIAFGCIAHAIPRSNTLQDMSLEQRISIHAFNFYKHLNLDTENVKEHESLINIGMTYTKMGKTIEAEAILYRVLEWRQRSLGSSHRHTLLALYSVCHPCFIAQRYPEAEVAGQRAYEGMKAVLGTENNWTHLTASLLASVYAKQNKFEEAEGMYKFVLAARFMVMEDWNGTMHLETKMVFFHLDDLYKQQSLWNEAQEMYEIAYSAQEYFQDDGTVDTVQADHILTNLGDVCESKGELQTALEWQLKAFESNKRALGERNERTLSRAHKVGLLYIKTMKFDKAEQLLHEFLRHCEIVLDSTHVLRHQFLDGLAMLYLRKGDLERAEVYCKQAIERAMTTFGRDHEYVLSCLERTGEILARQGKFEEAEECYCIVHEGHVKKLGNEHDRTLSAANNLAMAYITNNKLSAAELLLEPALKTCEASLGPLHGTTLCILDTTGLLYLGQSKFEKAELILRCSLIGSEKTLGPNHPNTLEIVQNLGDMMRGHRRLISAEMMYDKAASGYRKTLGEEHESTKAAFQQLVEIIEQREEQLGGVD